MHVQSVRVVHSIRRTQVRLKAAPGPFTTTRINTRRRDMHPPPGRRTGTRLNKHESLLLPSAAEQRPLMGLDFLFLKTQTPAEFESKSPLTWIKNDSLTCLQLSFGKLRSPSSGFHMLPGTEQHDAMNPNQSFTLG